MEDVLIVNPNANLQVKPPLYDFDFCQRAMLPSWDPSLDNLYSNFPGESSQLLPIPKTNNKAHRFVVEILKINFYLCLLLFVTLHLLYL
jgi:hypothetical protein